MQVVVVEVNVAVGRAVRQDIISTPARKIQLRQRINLSHYTSKLLIIVLRY